MNTKIKTIKEYLRCNIKDWQDFSVKICNGKCIITGQPYEVIHHKYPFYKILKETFQNLDIKYKENIIEYTSDELELIKNQCLELHFKYGAGACLTKNVHKEFHNIFGNDVTIEHFDKFVYYKKNNLNINNLAKFFNRNIKIKSKQEADKELKIQKLNFIKERQKEELKNNLQLIESENFKEFCPITYNHIKRNIRYLKELLLIAIENIDENLYSYEDNIVFFTSNKYICKRLDLSENSASEISNKIALFCYHNLINKLDDNIIPKRILKMSQIHNNYKKGMHHIGCYTISNYTNLFLLIEKQAKLWEYNHYSMQGISYEMFMRGEGKDVADRIFPQYKQIYDKKKKQIVDRTTTKFSDNLEDIIVLCIFNQIDERGYAIEKDVIFDVLSNMDVDIKHKTIELQIKKSMKEILDGYELQRIRANKELKTKYGITSKGYPYIIIKNK